MSSLWWRLAAVAGAARLPLARGPWILAYHRVTADFVPGATTPEMFDRHLDVLRARADVLPLGELLERVATRRATGREAAVTFDDGYRDQGEAARRALAAGVHTTIFIPTAFPESGRSFFWEGRTADESEKIKAEMRRGKEPPEGAAASDLMTWAEIRALAASGVGIESHGHTHRILAGLGDAALNAELSIAARTFEHRLGRVSRILAYPNGDWLDVDDRVNRAAAAAGFEYGLMAIFGHARRRDMLWRIRRPVVAMQSAAELASLLNGGGLPSVLKSSADRLRGRR